MKNLNRPWLGLIVLTLSCYAAFWCRPEWLAVWGIRLPLGHWFVDTYALLAASDAFALGLNPYENNPLDLLKVPHWYSDWWFWLHDVGLTRADAAWLGGSLVLVFLVVALLVLRPRNYGEMAYCGLVLCSPPVLLGANRANVDLLIFSAVALAGWLLTQHTRALRLLAPPVIALMAGLKFYPLAAAAALPFASQSRRENRLMLIFMTVLVGLVGLGLYDDVQRVRGLITNPIRLYTFGAVQIFPDGFGGGRAALAALALGLALMAVWWRRAPEMPAGLESRATMFFALGTVVVAGCFFAGVNYNYRLVFALLMLPLLGALRREAPAGLLRHLTNTALVGLLVLLWVDGITCLLLNLRLTSPDFATIMDGRQLINSVASWLWIGAVLGLWVTLARPACRRLFQP